VAESRFGSSSTGQRLLSQSKIMKRLNILTITDVLLFKVEPNCYLSHFMNKIRGLILSEARISFFT
jgi:hypothetical protein